MIVSRRFFAWEDVDLRRWLFRHPSFLVKIVAGRGVWSEDRLWEGARLWALVHDWPSITIPMRGRGVIRSATAAMEMGGGQVGFVARGSDFRARTEPPPGFGVFVQWDPAVFGQPSDCPLVGQRLSTKDQARIEAVLLRLTADSHAPMEAEAGVADLFQILGALGVLAARPDAGDLITSPAPRTVLTGRAIDRVLSRTSDRPMVVDLTTVLGCSERHARGLVREYADAYALQGATTWRSLVSLWRTYLAGLLMTAPNATTERVATVLGYGSPTAFCHSLANAGLPSPGEMRRIVADLG